MKTSYRILLATLLVSCGDPAGELENEEDNLITVCCAAPPPSVVYDEPPPVVPYRYDMYSGRISNVILTKYLEYPADLDGTTYKSLTLAGSPARFAAVCEDWDTTDVPPVRNISDATLIVVVRDSAGAFVTTLINDNTTARDGLLAGANRFSAMVQHNATSGTFRYTAYVYSNRLNTAHCALRYTTSPASGFIQQIVTAAPLRHIGGVMVRVGAIPAENDYFETETPLSGMSNGQLRPRTRMTLFRFSAASATAPISSVVVTASDPDERVTVLRTVNTPFVYDDTRENYLLVGRRSNDPTPSRPSLGTLLRADIVHKVGNGAHRFPLALTGGTDLGAAQIDSRGRRTFTPPSIQLPPGRYVIGIGASVTDTVGDLHGTTGPNAGLNPIVIIGRSPDRPGELLRGRMNGPAFEYWITECATSAPCAIRATQARKIPQGAFGAGGREHRFYLELDVGTSGRWFAPVVAKAEENVSFGGWIAQRNAETAELRVAAANMWYDDEEGQPLNDDEYRNAAELLAARGGPHGSNGAFSDPDVRGPMQLDADIVAVTEMGDKYGNAIIPSQRRAFQAVANANDERVWRSVYGMDEMWDVGGSGGASGAVFVASSHWPDAADEASLRPQPFRQGTEEAECDSSVDDAYFSCMLDDGSLGFSSGFIPATTRLHTTHRPRVMVAGAHLNFYNIYERSEQIESFNDMVGELISQQPWLANANGDTNPDGPHNRIILIGDLNIEAHGTGEHYRLLRQLRERFGYAVDVAMAIDGSYDGNKSFAMHDIGGFGDHCRQTSEDWAALPSPLPRYDHQLNLVSCSPDGGVLQTPWWASTWRGKQPRWEIVESIDRYDAIFLIGRGWEHDDPVRAYHVMQDSGQIPVNPFAPPSSPGATTSRGVSMWKAPHSSTIDYQPRFDIGDGKDPGAAAISSDHRPIAATLRIWAGDQAR